MDTSALIHLYRHYTGHQPDQIIPLSGAGSNRRYFRLHGSPTLIGVYGTSVEENRAFVCLSRHFTEKGFPVPHVYALSEDANCYLQEDLGDELLFDAMKKDRDNGFFGTETTELLKHTLRLLPRLQFEGADGLDFGCCYPQPEFNRRSVQWDLNYFKYCFLKATRIDFQEDRLEDDFECLANRLLQQPHNTFMYRDFQSRNVMVKEGKPYFIDFQGGRKGPFYYDVASFLWQAKANFPEDLRQELLTTYFNALQAYLPIDKTEFISELRHFVLFRTLQVLGAYGFRGYFEQKAHFLQSIPYAIENLRLLLSEGFSEYPYLCKVLQQLTELKQFAYERNKQKLSVRVMSFSYRKGIPEDPSGNGGGYVFDCRAIHNPGRYEQYKALTGLDQPVIRFLEENGEIATFLQHVYELTDRHVQHYIERGFTHLSICFGCTGGQHRSVYSAQHAAEHLHRKFGIQVELIHREQNITQILPSR